MSDEERSASEHRSVLKGMTVEASRKLVAGFRVEDVLGTPVLRNPSLAPETEWSCEALLALAALGAEVVGAKEAWAFIPPSGLVGGNYLGEMYRSPNGSLLPQAKDNPAWARRVLVLEGE